MSSSLYPSEDDHGDPARASLRIRHRQRPYNVEFSDENPNYRTSTQPSDPDLDSLPYSDDDRDPSDPERLYEQHVSDARLDLRDAKLELHAKYGFDWSAVPESELEDVDEEYETRLAAADKEYRAHDALAGARCSTPSRRVTLEPGQAVRARAADAPRRTEKRDEKWISVKDELWEAADNAAWWKSWCIWTLVLLLALLVVLGTSLLKAWSDVVMCESERSLLLEEAEEGLWYKGEGEGEGLI
ncbi:hypothetical protein PMIN06_009075 [Paraphaeosphaeria minitans]|uniref:Uncharacterized protein n=1 Tax=Paraphaeosphaeria minitans TaxID=565426 RepID=A0A9P6G734_9PLEO|nr:hypothetical protein PMIN01_11210 [Paraphaeosphaeria minitans]